MALAVTVMLIALGIGMRSNDSAIDEHLGSATATVISVSLLRTGIEFVDVTGATIRPTGGVLYPGLLSLGQQFVVEYSTQDPQIARVARSDGGRRQSAARAGRRRDVRHCDSADLVVFAPVKAPVVRSAARPGTRRGTVNGNESIAAAPPRAR